MLEDELKKLGFKNTIEGVLLSKRVIEILDSLNVCPPNSVFGYSTCRDEINRTVTDFKTYFNGQEFPHGWLAGYPGSGITGFNAYSHHCPDAEEKNLVIFYGPHVGVKEGGKIGKVLRRGQKHDSPSCGAAIQFLQRCRKAAMEGGEYTPQFTHEDDIEQHTIEKELSNHARYILYDENSRMLPEDEQIRRLVESNYVVVDEAMLKRIEEIKDSFKGGIVLIGGVMINADYPKPQYVDLRRFEIHRNNKIENLMKRLE